MMQKYLRILTVALLAIPLTSFAAFNDVTLTSDTIISAGGNSVNVSGSSAVLESIDVGVSSFSFVLLSGSSINMSTTGAVRLSTGAPSAYIVTNTCTASGSALTLKGPSSGTLTVTVTPEALACPGVSSGSGGGGGGSGTSSSGSSGGGAGSGSVTTSVTPPQTSSQHNASVSGLAGNNDLRTLIELLISAGIIPSDKAAAARQITAPTNTASSSAFVFTRDLTLNSTGDDVKELQKYLNAHGAVIALSGPGSVGQESTIFGGRTKTALMKFQKASGIMPASGFFGSKSRAYIAAHQ